MTDIKPKIVAALEAAGYTLVQLKSKQKYHKARCNNVWFDRRRVMRADVGTEGAEICRRIAGEPNGGCTIEQQGRFDSWFTDGYRGKGTAAI